MDRKFTFPFMRISFLFYWMAFLLAFQNTAARQNSLFFKVSQTKVRAVSTTVDLNHGSLRAIDTGINLVSFPKALFVTSYSLRKNNITTTNTKHPKTDFLITTTVFSLNRIADFGIKNDFIHTFSVFIIASDNEHFYTPI